MSAKILRKMRLSYFISIGVVLLALHGLVSAVYAMNVAAVEPTLTEGQIRQMQDSDWRAVLLVTGANLVLAMWNGYITRNVRRIRENQKGSMSNEISTIGELCNPSWRFCGLQFLRKLAANRRRRETGIQHDF